MPSNRKKLITKLDKMVADKVKERANYTCERCHKQFEHGDRRLHCSHIFSRSKMSTRWDMGNLQALCAGCHTFFTHKHPLDFYDWVQQKMGEKKFKALRQRSDFAVKFSEKDLEILLINLNQNV